MGDKCMVNKEMKIEKRERLTGSKSVHFKVIFNVIIFSIIKTIRSNPMWVSFHCKI